MTADTIPTLPLHGVLIEFHGIGVYLIGKSGIGKSETALQLLNQGARLICDDAPEFSTEISNEQLSGRCPEHFYGLMHIRDLGIINIMQLIRPDAFKSSQNIHFIIELVSVSTKPEKITQHQAEQLLSPDYRYWQHSVWNIPGLRLHISSGRPTALLVNTAVQQFLACDMVTHTHNIQKNSGP